MELDLKVCIPQLSYQKNLRLSTPFISIRQLEHQIRDRVPTLPPNLTYHSFDDPSSPHLDTLQPIKNFGYGHFMDEAKGLYIFYNEEEVIISEPCEIISSQNSNDPVSFSSNIPEKPSKKNPPEVVCIDEEVLVTILNPYLALNNVFTVKASLKIAILLEEYEKRIEWDSEGPRLGLMISEGGEVVDEELSIGEVTKEDEVILWVRQGGFEGKNKNSNVKRSLSQLENGEEDSDVEIIEKKIKPLDEKYTSGNKVNTPGRISVGNEESKSGKKSSVKVKTKSLKKTSSDKGKGSAKGKEEKGNILLFKDQYQILDSINKNFDKLIDYQRMQTKIIRKATPNAKLATTPDKPFVIEEDPTE